MTRKLVRYLIATIATLYVMLVLSLARAFDVAQAFTEYLRPTTIFGNYLPAACLPTDETPPDSLMHIVEGERKRYNLTLQRVVVCRSAQHLGLEHRNVGLPLGDRDPCLPLREGCCTCQSGRHVVVQAADPTPSGSVLVSAYLVLSRWNYVQLKWHAIKWPVVTTGAVLALFTMTVVLAVWQLVLAR